MMLNAYKPIMGILSNDLREMGYEPTNRDSPFSEQGKLWSKGYEIVCDHTAIVIRTTDRQHVEIPDPYDEVHRYRRSRKVKLPGGHISSYDWGDDDSGFRY